MKTDYFPQEAQNLVAEKLGPFLSMLLEDKRTKSLLAAGPTTLEETLSVWFLPANAVEENSSDSLDELARPTDQWHHQIEVGGSPMLFARSKGSSAEDTELEQVFQSELPLNISETLQKLSSSGESDSLIRLVSAPAYRVEAIWVIDSEEKIIVVKAPAGSTELCVGQQYETAEFLKILRKQGTIEGIIF